MQFKLEHTCPDTQARTGTLQTAHSTIATPIFMPVGTLGTVKGIEKRHLEADINAPIILGNTYHLYLRPGLDVLKNAGGLHGFAGWNRSLLTDSGGFQVYSLAQSRKLTEDGVTFKGHIDGTKHHFTPERVIDIQRTIGADIIMAFDECPPYPSEKSYVENSMHLTHRWLDRCIKQFNATQPHYGYQQTLFPIVQGGVFADLRKQSAQYIAQTDCPGNAIGGLSVGEPAEQMYDITQQVCEILPHQKPRYLMGVGTPENLLECIARGVDMFDCVMPTRNGRNGQVFTTRGILNMRNQKWATDNSPLDPGLDSYVSKNYSLAYVRHLITSKEMLGMQICSLQNLVFYLWLMRTARQKITEGTFLSWKQNILPIITQRP